MQTQTVQLRVTLPTQLQGYLQAKASRLGLNMSAYVKNLIINDIRGVDFPVYEMSEKSLADLAEAKEEERTANLARTNDIRSFLKNI